MDQARGPLLFIQGVKEEVFFFSLSSLALELKGLVPGVNNDVKRTRILKFIIIPFHNGTEKLFVRYLRNS